MNEAKCHRGPRGLSPLDHIRQPQSRLPAPKLDMADFRVRHSEKLSLRVDSNRNSISRISIPIFLKPFSFSASFDLHKNLVERILGANNTWLHILDPLPLLRSVDSPRFIGHFQYFRLKP